MTRSRTEDGAVLVAVLLVLAVVAGLAAALVGTERGAISALTGEDAQFRRETALRSALAGLGGQLAADDPALPRDGRRFRPGGPAHDRVTAQVQAVSGLVNANTAGAVLLGGLLQACGATPEQAGAMADHVVATRKDTPFSTPADLAALFAGPDPAWACAQAALTIWGAAEVLDPDTAPRLALLAVPGMTPDAADALIAARQAPDWPTQGRAQAVELYRPFLAGQDQGIYRFTLRHGDDRMTTSGTGIVGSDGRFHLIGLDWPESEASDSE